MKFLVAFLLLGLASIGALTAHARADGASGAALTIRLANGDTLQVERARLVSTGVRVRTLAGRDSVLATKQVRGITDEQGEDRTKDLMVHGREVRIGDPGRRVERRRFRRQGPFVAVDGGYAGPIGGFADLGEPGYVMGASIYWRTRLHDTYGIQLQRASFGADPAYESAFSLQSSGAVDEMQFQLWSLSARYRYLIHPDHRFTPFIHVTLGIQGLKTVLKGPGATGSHTKVGSSRETGVGLGIRLKPKLSGEVLAAYAFSSGTSSTTAGTFRVYTSGWLQSLQFRVALSRRLGT